MMLDQLDPENGAKRRLRLIARIMSVGILGFALIMLISHLFYPEPTVEDYPWIENLMPVIILLSVLGLALAFRWELLGGAISLGFFLLHLLVFWWIRGTFFPLGMLVIFLPIPIAALLFIYLGRTPRATPPQ